MGVLIGFRKDMEGRVPKLAGDVRRRIIRLRDELADAEQEERYILNIAGAAGIEITEAIYQMDGTASDDAADEQQAA